MKKKNNDGFTLIELIIVITIMAVLIGLLSTMYLHYVTKAKKTMDRNTAQTIYESYEAAALTNDNVLDLLYYWQTAGNNTLRNLVTRVSATVDGVTETYDVILVVSSEHTFFDGTQPQYQAEAKKFYHDLNSELGLVERDGANKDMIPRYKINRPGTYAKPNAGGRATPYGTVDRWRIVLRMDNGEIEVWSADGSTYGGWPQYRVYPNPDDVYR